MTRPLLLCLFALTALTGCTKFDALNATVPAWNYARTADIAYGQLPRQRLDVYRPCAVAQQGGNARVVVFFYGGYWQGGSKSDYRFAAQAFASEGFVTVMPDYRIYPDVKFPAFVQDGAAAVRWVHDHIADYGGDPQRVYLAGHSAGAHIAALLTLDDRYLNAVGLDRSAIRATAALSGPYDFVPDPSSRALFGMAEGDKAASPDTQPIHFADGRSPPMLLIHGAADDVCGPENATHLAAAIEMAGGQARLILYPDRGHPSVVLALAWSFRYLAPTLRDVAAFVREH